MKKIKVTDEELAILKKELVTDKKRIEHVIMVSDMAQELAILHGIAKDEDYLKRLHVACIFHDICKRYKTDEYKNILPKKEYKKFSKTPNLHGVTGAYYIKDILKINDNDIFFSIKYHTTGHKSFNIFSKLVYLSDKIDLTRDSEEINKIREIAKIDINYAILMHIKYVEEKLKSINKKIDKNSHAFKKQIIKEIIKIGIQ